MFVPLVIINANAFFPFGIKSVTISTPEDILPFVISIFSMLGTLFNLPFTEVVISGGRRLEAKINQSKRAWCKSHALNIFI
jgi:hypothetical protein